MPRFARGDEGGTNLAGGAVLGLPRGLLRCAGEGKLIRHRLTAPHPFGARRFAPVQTAFGSFGALPPAGGLRPAPTGLCPDPRGLCPSTPAGFAILH
ncbi:MAG: hypothetical protein R3Y56_09795 [Akkermansia sp.]